MRQTSGPTPASTTSPAAKNAPERWHIGNRFAELDIFATGAALHHARFHLPGGKTVSPMAEASWHETGLEGAAGHIQTIGGEWPCVPFGTTAHDKHHHGFGSDMPWQVLAQDDDSILLGITYPAGHKVKKLERRIRLLTDRPAIECALHIYVNEDCVLPIGLHPIFRLPQEEDAFAIHAHQHGRVMTAPQDIAPRDSKLAAHEVASETGQVRRKDGQSSNIWRQTVQLGEEIIAISDSEGHMRLDYVAEGFCADLRWDAKDFPNCLIWVANPGLQAISPAPHFQGIGIEPVNSYFDRNDLAPDAELAGGVTLRADQPWSCRYEISCSLLDTQA
ncbi:hypothetical protein [Thalassospira marina]|uniref:Aldose epimerase n=1 Tax=Thalassospira marina TaxID=2048283 RepID=A0ABM6Q4R6_9PROT|nr:hypothetical protein [Thalassospira marina]AUG51466.1 hypothetical protein CSC3H3_01105 [Thalassospira marina]